MHKSISTQIKEIRDKHNLSQKRFGKRLGLSGKTISAYETGKITPPLKVLQNISSTYNTHIIGINTKTKDNVRKKVELIEKNLFELKEVFNHLFEY